MPETRSTDRGRGNDISAGQAVRVLVCEPLTHSHAMSTELSIRIDADNPDHHLWDNHGTWWVHYTLHVGGVRVRRVRRSLGTADREEARRRRDRLLADLTAAFPKTGGAA